ncbi:MAG: CDP-archaeol synthase [Candidatus Hodarchaeales archaeon]|jgi:CDP-diglyceride synthetase
MVDIIESIINSVIFIFPAFVANAAPVILGRGGQYNRPIDGGRFWKDGKRILGDGKTIRGFISGTLSGMVTCVAIVIFLSNIGYPVAAINHFNNGFLFPLLQFMENNYVLQAVLIGFLLGCGALLGDLAGSFIKRCLSNFSLANRMGCSSFSINPWTTHSDEFFGVFSRYTRCPALILFFLYLSGGLGKFLHHQIKNKFSLTHSPILVYKHLLYQK